MVTVAEALTLLLNLLVAIAACAGAIAAFIGLSSWRAQGLWERDTDLARKLLLALRSQQDRFSALRARFMSAGEMQAAVGAEINSLDKESIDAARLAAVNARFDRLAEGQSDFYALAIEADVLWGTNLEESYNAMRIVENDVFFAHQDLWEAEKRGKNSREDREEKVKQRRIAFGSDGDEISQSYKDSAASILNVAKRKLGRRN